MARNVFYSFHYKPDAHRAAKIRNIGVIEGSAPAQDNDWETITKGGDLAIKSWITNQMKGRSCLVVLVGTGTANRKWINYEIIEAWNKGMGVVAIYIHGITDLNDQTSTIGENPFDFINFERSGGKLSTVAKCYNPSGANSKERYNWISEHLANAVEEAIKIRKAN